MQFTMLRYDIAPDETTLIGAWTRAGERVVEDAVSQRIRSLVRSYLKLLATSDDGWKKLFQDPADGRLWELTFPFSKTHGGGPPALMVVDEVKAREKYTWR